MITNIFLAILLLTAASGQETTIDAGVDGTTTTDATTDTTTDGSSTAQEHVDLCLGVECGEGKQCLIQLTRTDEECLQKRNCPEEAACIDEDTKPGVCPEDVPIFSNISCFTPPNPHGCLVDDHCSGRFKCCPSAACGSRVCGMPRLTKEGSCPPLILLAEGASCRQFPNNQLVACEGDEDCPSNHKCCHTDTCGSVCATPTGLNYHQSEDMQQQSQDQQVQDQQFPDQQQQFQEQQFQQQQFQQQQFQEQQFQEQQFQEQQFPGQQFPGEQFPGAEMPGPEGYMGGEEMLMEPEGDEGYYNDYQDQEQQYVAGEQQGGHKFGDL